VLTAPASAPATGVVKILDWGLACLKPPGERPAMRGTDGIVGTADYLAPEQARDAQAADIRSDIYGLGCTFYYLLTGEVPFPGTSLGHKLVQHQTAEPAAVELRNPAVPHGLAAVLQRMMAKRPQDRFQTPAAVALALAPYCRAQQAACVAARRDGASATHEDTPLPQGLPPRPAAGPHATAVTPRPTQATPRPTDTHHR
jgi:serine/threonine-protein kinase